MKKILITVFVLSSVLLCGCNAADSNSAQSSGSSQGNVASVEENKPSNKEIVENILKDNPLTDEEMFSSVKEYWENFNELFAYNGDDITVEVVNENGSVVIYSTQDSSKHETVRWDSVQEAFSYLAENALVDLQGNVITSVEDMISEFEVGKETSE